MKNTPVARHPLKFFLGLIAGLLVLGTGARLGLIGYFHLAKEAGAVDVWQALSIGLRFDLRIAVICLLPALCVSWLPWLGRRLALRATPMARRLMGAYWLAVCLVWVLASVLDFGYYAYLGTRVSAYAFVLARDAGDAVLMIWQSYPVLWILLGIGVLMTLLWGWFAFCWRRWIVQGGQVDAASGKRLRRWGFRALIVILSLALIHGRWSQYPLRWSDSQRIADVALRPAALNPIQNLVDTQRFAVRNYDETRLPDDIVTVRAMLGLDGLPVDARAPLLRCAADVRHQPLPGGRPRPVNVVVIILESFSAHKTGAFGSTLGVTPNFDRLAGQGLLYTRAFTSHMGTARGVFATLTGIPDFSPESTASRNPEAVEQQMIANEFVGYDHHYFIGGSTSWANVRGFLSNGIDGMHFVEEADMQQHRADVWGVPDHKLFEVANQTLSQLHAPFFAVIQTASNHKPYTIPDDAAGQLPALPVTEAQAQRFGFSDGVAEVKSLQYLDWSLGRFFAQAEKAPYFADTLFVMIGDHGISTPAGPHMPPLWTEWRLTQGHVPLLFLAPAALAARRDERWAMQVDVMPTIAGLVGIPYRNATMGRDLLNSPRDAASAIGQGYAETWDRYWMHGDWVYRRDPAGKETARHWRSGLMSDAASRPDAAMPAHRDAWSNVALYLMTHNRRLAPELTRAVCGDAAPAR